jgi:hypothetical protein
VKMQKVVLWVVTSAPKMEAVFSSKWWHPPTSPHIVTAQKKHHEIIWNLALLQWKVFVVVYVTTLLVAQTIAYGVE